MHSPFQCRATLARGFAIIRLSCLPSLIALQAGDGGAEVTSNKARESEEKRRVDRITNYRRCHFFVKLVICSLGIFRQNA